MTSGRRPARDGDLVARVREGFATLRLPQAGRRFDELLAGPEPDLSRLEWLWAVLEPQVRARVEAQVERRIRESRLPARKTLSDFDFAFQPKLDHDLILELSTLAFLGQGRNVLLAGWSGTGKSHIAMALALNACMANKRVRYTTSADMLGALNESLADSTLAQTLKRYTKPDLLVIDEVGLEQVERPAASRAGLMQKVLLPRYGEVERRSTIITSNIDWKAWGDYLGDQLGAAALLDRLLHHSHVIVIDGPSWRDHEHKKDVAGRSRSAKPAGDGKNPTKTKKHA